MSGLNRFYLLNGPAMTSFREHEQNAAQVYGALYLENLAGRIHFRDILVVGIITLKLISTGQVIAAKLC
jgi:hypothetical protein